MFLRAVDGDVDGAAADAREIAGSLLKDGRPGVKDVSAYHQWIRKDMRHWMKTGEILDNPAMAVTHARTVRVRARLPNPIGPPDVFAMVGGGAGSMSQGLRVLV